MLEVLNQDYIRTARAKGVSDPPVVWKHALKNAAIPIVTIVGIELGTLLGRLGHHRDDLRVAGRGPPVACRRSTTATTRWCRPRCSCSPRPSSLVNLLVDVVYTYLDPRIRLR